MKKYDPHFDELQYLQDLASSYWNSEILFSALETEIFEVLQQTKTVEEIGQIYHCEKSVLKPFLTALVNMGFVCEYKGNYCNTLLTNKYLIKDSLLYQGDFILWMKESQGQWQNLSKILKDGLELEKDFREQKQYTKAMNVLLKGMENVIETYFEGVKGVEHILGIGPGAEKVCQNLLQRFPQGQAKSYNNRKIHAERQDPVLEQWDDGIYEIIFLSNLGILYSEEEITHILTEASKHLSQDGYLVIYDVFLDEGTLISNMKSLNRVLKTKKGKALSPKWISHELEDLGMKKSGIISLEGGRGILFSSRTWERIADLSIDKKHYLLQKLKNIGFKNAEIINPKDDIYLTNVAHLKCKYGCEFYNKETCYKECDLEYTKKILGEFSYGILVEGEPPTKDFQISMLQAEKQAFKLGYYKAFSLWAGPCSICEHCIQDKENCTKTRPSMENYGIDVFATVQKQGDSLKTLASKDGFVKYYGLLLLE
ncbi:putative metal-binding protein [Alkalibaculum bacchi]|uniref:Putative metal-binding protein n=1 Tax=Alkalibaculum bacchi TaxID=645887 RepID=A0A366II79_9FIRM|nr:DUF2284 domain-containing protein [Alkalibaculum bacchi]RBP70165.1 putative metal-binding protein [Alkalibaculum bacchi]